MFVRRSLVLFVLIAVELSSALYFHIGETERKCFIEEIPDETTVIGIILFCMLNRHLES